MKIITDNLLEFLRWHVAWGRDEDTLRAQAKRYGKEPGALKRKPKLLPWEERVWAAFSKLSERRIAHRPILWRDLGWYLQLCPDPSFTNREMVEALTTLDAEWVRIDTENKKRQARRIPRPAHL